MKEKLLTFTFLSKIQMFMQSSNSNLILHSEGLCLFKNAEEESNTEENTKIDGKTGNLK